MSELPGGTVTMLFSDVEASTALLKRLGDRWPDVLERQRTILRTAIEAAGGVIVDCQGDAMFAAFGSAAAGMAAAIAAQTSLASEHWPDGTSVRVRMALHTGEPVPTANGDGYTGIDVVRAARLCSAGHGGQVLLSEAARLVSGATTTDLGMAQLQDIDGSEHVYQLVAPGLASDFPPLRRTAALPMDTVAGEGGDDAETRIEQAANSLEDRIKRSVAADLERSLGALGRKDD
jgi:class 3 adenylate cyclase